MAANGGRHGVSASAAALRLRQGVVGLTGSALLCGLLAWARRRRSDGTLADLEYGNESRPASWKMQRGRTTWAAAALSALLSAEVSAHAVLVKAVPGQDAVLDQSPPTVSVWFNEALEAAFLRLQCRTVADRWLPRARSRRCHNGL